MPDHPIHPPLPSLHRPSVFWGRVSRIIDITFIVGLMLVIGYIAVMAHR